MKRILFLISIIGSISLNAQTGIGTTTPNASAKLDVYSDNKGFLPPRITLTSVSDASTIPTPAVGLLVYNTGNNINLAAGYYYWNGSNWATIATASSPNQTVDYVSTSLSSNIYAVGNNTDIKFQQLNGGTIPYNTLTGVYTLSANKTYMLQASLRISSASVDGAYLAYTWVDAITNIELVTNSQALSSSKTSTASFGSKNNVQIIYTPTTNQNVKIRTIEATGTQTIWLGTATIIQIGSSAIVNPWVLSGNDVYNTSGKVGIGTNTPDASAIVDINSTTQGITIPSMTTAQRIAIASPKLGLQVFDLTTKSVWYFDGTSWNNTVTVASYGDIKTGIQSSDHNGWIKLDGRLKSTLTMTQQAQATALGFGTNLPDATNAFLVQNGSTLASISSSNTKTIIQANLPNVTLGGNTNINGSHVHTINVNNNNVLTVSGGNVTAMKEANNNWTSGIVESNANVIASAGNHSHTITTNSINGGVSQTPLDITPKSLSVNTFIYLGN